MEESYNIVAILKMVASTISTEGLDEMLLTYDYSRRECIGDISWGRKRPGNCLKEAIHPKYGSQATWTAGRTPHLRKDDLT